MTTNPSRVRASQTIYGEAPVYARRGDVGDVLDSTQEQDGAVVLLVKFPNAPEATSCELGDTVEPFLSVVDEPTSVAAGNDAEPITKPACVPALLARSWRVVGAAAALAAVVLGLVCWWSSGARREAGTMDTPGVSTIHLTNGQRLPEREDEVPKNWMRAPCPRDPSVRTHAGACFVVLAGKPPCTLGVELKGECVMPIDKGQRFPSTIAADHR